MSLFSTSQHEQGPNYIDYSICTASVKIDLKTWTHLITNISEKSNWNDKVSAQFNQLHSLRCIKGWFQDLATKWKKYFASQTWDLGSNVNVQNAYHWSSAANAKKLGHDFSNF